MVPHQAHYRNFCSSLTIEYLASLIVQAVITGDLNISIICHDVPAGNLPELAYLDGLTNLTTLPTRVTGTSETLIRCLFYCLDDNLYSGILRTGTNDHTPIFCLLPARRARRQSRHVSIAQGNQY